MELNETTRKAAIDILALMKKDGKTNTDAEVDIDNYLRGVIDKYASKRVEATQHYLLAKFVHTVANVTKENFSMFDQMMKSIGYHITRQY